MHVTATAAIKRRKTRTRLILVHTEYSTAPTNIRASPLLDERLEPGACMPRNSTRPTFRDLSEIVPRVHMVTGGPGGYLPTEFQGLKGWRRRWIHSAITYI